MPRTLKRRSDAISRDDNGDDGEEGASASDSSPPPRHTQQQQPSQRHNRRPSTPLSNDSDNDASDVDNTGTQASVSQQQLKIKNLVRLALSSEYARQPLRRTDIQAKVIKGDSAQNTTRVNFRAIFFGAQKVLRDVFGMELVDLPVRERTGLNDRRKAASQKATQKETQATQRARQREVEIMQDEDTQSRGRAKDPVLSAQSWILVNILPEKYRARPELFKPSKAPDEGSESTYIALYTLVVSLLYLHTPSGPVGDAKKESQGPGSQVEDSTEPMSDAKLQRYLGRLNLSDWTPMGTEGANVEKMLARMIREGYIEKRRDSTGGEEIIEWVVGPRGKREVGRRGVAGLVRGVYGFGVDGRVNRLEEPLRAEEADGADDGGQSRPAVKMEKSELERRLKRTLGDVVSLKVDERQPAVTGVGQEPE